MRTTTLSSFLIALFLTSQGSAAPSEPEARSDAQRLAMRRTPIVEVFETARDSVVNISSTEIITMRRRNSIDQIFEDLFEDRFNMPSRSGPQQYTRTSIGSGFVLHPDGYIVTNAHVVARTTERMVMFADGSEYEAQLIALDVDRDLAILKIEAERPLPALPLGRSDDLMVGETAIAIGNPLGYQHTITSGVISAVDRTLEFNAEVRFTGLIQTDASINPGNSGGPLLNVLGELIGINTAVRNDAQNIGFAIPVDQLRVLLPELLDLERRYRIEVGMQVDNLDEPRVLRVRADSPADRAGICCGDVLTHIDGRPIAGGVEYYIDLIGREAGSRLGLSLRRGSQSINTTLTVEEHPLPDGRQLARQKLGLDLRPVPLELAQRLQLRRDTGLVVVHLESGSPGYQIGIEPNDVLVSIGRHYLSTLDDLGVLLESVKPGDVVPFSVVRLTSRGKVLLNGSCRSR
jgi:serine protease Do